MSFFDGVTTWGQFIIRMIAAVGGFVVGYMLSGPFWRLFWRIALRKPIPPGLLPWVKFCTGLVFAALLYTLVHLGGGGGWGWGGGGSGTTGGVGSGTGSGKGDGSTTGDPSKKGKAGVPTAKTPGREILDVELLGGALYKGEGKYYLIDRKEPAVKLDGVDEAFKKRPEKIELHIYYSAQSVGKHHSAAERLRELAGKYQIPLVETAPDEKSTPKSE